jgi:hypothetical protein
VYCQGEIAGLRRETFMRRSVRLPPMVDYVVMFESRYNHSKVLASSRVKRDGHPGPEIVYERTVNNATQPATIQWIVRRYDAFLREQIKRRLLRTTVQEEAARKRFLEMQACMTKKYKKIAIPFTPLHGYVREVVIDPLMDIGLPIPPDCYYQGPVTYPSLKKDEERLPLEQTEFTRLYKMLQKNDPTHNVTHEPGAAEILMRNIFPSNVSKRTVAALSAVTQLFCGRDFREQIEDFHFGIPNCDISCTHPLVHPIDHAGERKKVDRAACYPSLLGYTHFLTVPIYKRIAAEEISARCFKDVQKFTLAAIGTSMQNKYRANNIDMEILRNTIHVVFQSCELNSLNNASTSSYRWDGTRRLQEHLN